MTSDAGLLTYRELDVALGLIAMIHVTADNQVVEWRATVTVCPNSMKKTVLDPIAGLFLFAFVTQGMFNLPEFLLILR